MSELLIRASRGDHLVLEDLLAPSLLHQTRPVDRVVLNAHDAARDERLLSAARKSGAPLLIDPLTMLLQHDVDPEDPWVRLVPFGRSDALPADELTNQFMLERIVAQAVEFQIDRGATTIIPPYFYAESPDSPAFTATLAAISLTARRMRTDGLSLPLMPLLCAQLRGFASGADWQRTLDRFAATAVDVGPQALAVYLSPAGDGKESYAKLLQLHLAVRQLRAAGVPTIAWRQGAYGAALVAAGLDGYECGMGIGERSDVAAFISARKPGRTSKGFAASGIYIPELHRSLPAKVASTLLDDRRLRGRVLCESSTCCPQGAESMLHSNGRAHSVRSRARELGELAAMPSQAWRLNDVAKQAASSHVTASKANEVLAQAGLAQRINVEGYASLEQVAKLLRMRPREHIRHTA